MLNRLLRRFASRRLARQIADLEAALEAERRRLAVAEAEIQSLSLALARDRQRIKAEIAAYARQQAEHEGRPNDHVTR